MVLFIIRRLFLEALPSLFVIITITFFLIRLAPGGPFSAEKTIDPETLAKLKEHYYLDKPLPVQYFHYLNNVLHGHFGPSIKHPGRTVTELIAESFPVSLELGIYPLIFAIVIGISAGLFAASKPESLRDYLTMSVSTAGICIPTFVLGPLLVFIFAITLRWVNVAGWESPTDRILPSITLGMVYIAYISRLTRGGLLDVLSLDFIRTARAKGCSDKQVLIRHALRGALLPVVSFLGPAAAGMITGSFVVETIFSIPGLGRFFVAAAFNRDYMMIMGTVTFYAAIIILFNTIVDILLAFLNPRLRGALS
jgi:oligopeptide transport system permease protein